MASDASFLTTRWTRVCLAKADSEDGQRALADLCDAYYQPVVAFLRCTLRDAEAARDLSHAFFAEMLAGGTIRGADAERGRFRAYLLGAVKHFLARERESAQRLKRGGGVLHTALDAEEAMQVVDKDQRSPEVEFDRQWAITVLARAVEVLRVECDQQGKAQFFEIVKPLLTGDAGYGDQSALAGQCELSPDAFRAALSRLRKRLREAVKQEVASTLEDASAVNDEMQSLFAALGG